MHIVPVILTGGSGTRLWPLSRRAQPKPFLSLDGGATLLQDTVRRLDIGGDQRQPLIVCNEEHRFLVVEQLTDVHCNPEMILLEPEGRNTAPALTAAAIAAIEGDGRKDALLVVMPADHVFRDLEAFRAAVSTALIPAEAGYLMTFGITPDRPETGYGYIHAGETFMESVHTVRQFVEKPDADTARAYLESIDYYWNSGIFVLRARRWLEEVGTHAPAMLEAVRGAWAGGARKGNFLELNADAFATSPNESIDRAVMEKCNRVGMVPLNAGWSDVGSWSSLSEVYECDDLGNILQGDVVIHSTHDSIISSHSRLVTVVGLSDVIIAETGDAVMVTHKEHAQDVKKIVEQLNVDGREESRQHRRVRRPWGAFEPVDAGPKFQVKRLTVFPGASLSLQLHHHRAEHWVVVSGRAQVTRDDEVFELNPNQSTYIPIGTRHRLANPGDEPLEVIEVQSGDYLGEDDIIRFDDIYGRDTAD